jgi:hypothetical protein
MGKNTDRNRESQILSVFLSIREETMLCLLRIPCLKEFSRSAWIINPFGSSGQALWRAWPNHPGRKCGISVDSRRSTARSVIQRERLSVARRPTP